MEDDFDPVVVKVRADAASFRQEMAALQYEMEARLGAGAETAGRGIASALGRAARTGKIEFEDLARVAGKALGDIAAAALRVDGSANGGVAASGFGGLLQSAVGSLLGLPGRATGGPVGPGKAYVVGERGPEIFVPTSSGRVEAPTGSQAGNINITVHVAVPPNQTSEHLALTGRQVARDVARVLDRARTSR